MAEGIADSAPQLPDEDSLVRPLLWVVRAGRQAQFFEEFENKKVITVGYPKTTEVSGLTAEELRDHVAQAYLGEPAGRINAISHQLVAFALHMEEGDLILTPSKGTGEVLLGRVASPYRYSHREPVVGNHCHFRSINWMGHFPLQQLPSETQTSLKSALTIFAAGAQGELRSLFDSSRNYWWVCQGLTYNDELSHGYMWASAASKTGGPPRASWANLKEAKPGDFVIHYSSKHVRALSVVTEAAQISPRPVATPDDSAEQGWLVRTRYFELDKPIDRDSIPVPWRIGEDPFDTKGAVKQGCYFHPLSLLFGAKLRTKFREYWPPGSPWVNGALGTGWDEFIRWAKRFKSEPNFDKLEKQYKLDLAESLRQIDESAEAHDWIEALAKVLNDRSNNLVNPYARVKFIDWARGEPDVAKTAVTTLWEEVIGSMPDALEHYFAQVDRKRVDNAAANQISIAAFLLLRTDASLYPPYKQTALRKAAKLTNVPQVPANAEIPPGAARFSLIALYEHALGFFDLMIEEAAQRGLDLGDRLDAQGAAWAVTDWPLNDPPVSGWSEEDRQALEAYRGGAVVEGGIPGVEENLRSLIDLLDKRVNVVFYGPPGTGKTRAAFGIADLWRQENGPESVIEVTFHPSYSYEDFVQGWRPDGTGDFQLTSGELLRACDAAINLQQDGKRALLVIDEINRGDVARIFGELITYIERDKRERPFRLTQSPGKEFRIPKNLNFLGTMNTADKSISLIDVALRRRFAFVEFAPNPEVFRTATEALHQVHNIDLAQLLSSINERLLRGGIEPDRAIGHALLFIDPGAADPESELLDHLQYDIYPLVAEYCYLDRYKIARILEGLVDAEGRFRKAPREQLLGAVSALAIAPTPAEVLPNQADLLPEVPEIEAQADGSPPS